MRSAVLAGVAVLALGGCHGNAGAAIAPPATGAVAANATVEWVVDGDTIDVTVDGREERVRLIGIDTPESVAHDRPVECFGPEAKARLAELLPAGTEVRLERDVEARDRFGRLLAYVFRSADDAFVNRLLVAEGYAESRPFEPNLARQGELDRAEDDARQAGRGLWPACGGTNVPVGPPG
jgi:micrococcal nuclease